MAQEPIQRLDIIKAGGSFTIDRFKIDKKSLGHRLKHLEDQQVEVHTTRNWKEVGFRDASSVTWMELDLPFSASFTPPELKRERLAAIIEASDKEAAEALRCEVPMDLDKYVHEGLVARYHADTLAEYGLCPDAFLYVGADFGDYQACEYYLRLGADAVRPTFDGHCAALRGLEYGLWDTFNKVEHLEARHLKHGESYLFRLARGGQDDHLVRAVKMGANLTVKNAKGETCLDYLRGEERLRVDAALAEKRATKLDAAWGSTQPTKDNLQAAQPTQAAPAITTGHRRRF